MNNVLIVLLSFVVMEAVAWLTHRYLMHGPLWCLHRDHHQPHEGRTLEWNDLFFIIFAAPAVILIGIGANSGWDSWHGWVGVGITLYGLAYFMVHELFIHRRVKVFGPGKHPYFVALRRAHKAHHRHLEKDDGECFGMLIVPWRFFTRAWTEERRPKDGPTAPGPTTPGAAA